MTRVEGKIMPKAINYFERELAMIQDASLQAFFYNALAVSPQSFHDDEKIQLHAKKVFHILRGMLDHRHVEGAVRDAMLGTVLLCDIMFNELEEELRSLHTVAVRTYLENRGVDQDVQKQFWENIMRAVESHNGDKGASPILAAKIGTAEDEIANAFAMANLPYISIDLEAIYHDQETSSEDKEEN